MKSTNLFLNCIWGESPVIMVMSHDLFNTQSHVDVTIDTLGS